MPVSNRAAQANHPSAFQRFVLPGLAFKAVVIGGGYATGREIAEFFLPAGPWGGIAAMAVATVIWCVVCATTFVFARRLRERDYRSFFRALLGRAWPVFEIAYVIFVVLILAVFGAAAGAIGSATFGAPPIVGTLCLMAAIAVCYRVWKQERRTRFHVGLRTALRRLRRVRRIRPLVVRQPHFANLRICRRLE